MKLFHFPFIFKSFQNLHSISVHTTRTPNPSHCILCMFHIFRSFFFFRYLFFFLFSPVSFCIPHRPRIFTHEQSFSKHSGAMRKTTDCFLCEAPPARCILRHDWVHNYTGSVSCPKLWHPEEFFVHSWMFCFKSAKYFDMDLFLSCRKWKGEF